MPVIKEADLLRQVTDYLKIAYPSTLYRVDYGAGLKMTINQAVYQKRIQKCKAWPDLFIAERRGGYGGLFIELKRNYKEVFKSDGDFRNNPHIQEQLEVLEQLFQKGYAATFAYGFEHTKHIIDDYLKQPA